MTLTPAEMDRKIDEHFGFEARDDVEGVLSTLTPDVLHDVVGWPTGPARGREYARPFYEALFADLSEGEVTCLGRLYGEGFLVDESVWRGRAVGRPRGVLRGGLPGRRIVLARQGSRPPLRPRGPGPAARVPPAARDRVRRG